MIDLTPILRAYTNFRIRQISRLNPTEIQREQLRYLVGQGVDTKFGRDHGFGKVKTVEDFQKAVPLRKYEQFWQEYWKESYPIHRNITWPGLTPYFCVSSGTSSGTTKYIPCSKQMLRSNTKAGLDLLAFHLHNRPTSRIFTGKNFLMGGSTELVREAPGVYSGDLSGITARELPWWVKSRYYPPPNLALIKSWEEKINTFAEEAPKEKIRTLGGVPSWLLIFIEKLRERYGVSSESIAHFFPDLELLIHGGVNFTPYYDRFQRMLNGTHAELREVYPASEGFIAIADRSFGQGLKVNLDHNIFYEFVPLEELESENPTRHWIGNVQPEVQYAVVLTTCAGLWSYVIGDTVKFVDTQIPRLLVTGRISYFLSAFGEHLIGEEVEDAVSTAAQHIGVELEDFSVGAIYPNERRRLGGHLYFVELAQGELSSEQLEEFAIVLDQRLSQRNEDYESHRAKGFGLAAPTIEIVPKGFFQDWMKSRGKLGGQNKVPRLISKVELFDDLKSFAANKLGRIID